MAKKPVSLVATPKFAGKKIAFVGQFGYRDSQREQLEKVVQEEAGEVVDAEKNEPDLLVEGTGVRGKPPAALTKIRKRYPSVRVVSVADLNAMLAYTAEEFFSLLRMGPYPWQRWSEIQQRVYTSGSLDLSGRDFRSIPLDHANFHSVKLDNGDFRGMALYDVSFDSVSGAKFDGATLRGGSLGAFREVVDCSLKGVVMDDVRWNPAQFTKCDFTKSRLSIRTGSYTRATECIFKDADLSGSELEQSWFTGCDLRGANLTGVKLNKSDFTGANFAGADCTQADFRDTKLVNANLRKAKFRDAILAGADFTGADIAGADFTGANLAGVIVTGVDTSKAKGFDHKPARTAGSQMTELAKVASQSKRLEASIELGLPNDEFVLITASLSSYGTHKYTGANHTRYTDGSTFGSYVDAPNFEQGMLNLADLWAKGQPRLDTVKVTAKKCPRKPAELEPLARAAWCEALGIATPTDAEWKQQADALSTAHGELREAMLAELRGGAAGVKKFNARTDKEREKVGKLHKLDFSKAKLANATLNNLDLQGTKFEEATLTGATFERAKLQGTSFVKVNAAKSYFALCKANEASFEGAKLTACNLRAASFLRANFKNADLTKSEFDYSNLCGADLTGATLKGVTFNQVKFDANTKFPPGFMPPDEMIWTGAGAHPGKLSRVAATAAGSMDIETFVKGLGGKIEASRVQKAIAMLTAERFQLYADVTDTAVTGLVKSQSNKDLLYSCRLAADGQFGCGTQNLKLCGGLHGALCKHLLVLVIGLAKAGRLDPATVDNWINTSKVLTPNLDKEALSETFLKYDGAESGQIDWRPTETIPEDFYAM